MPKLYWVVLGAGSVAVCLRCSGLGPAIVVYYFPRATKGRIKENMPMKSFSVLLLKVNCKYIRVTFQVFMTFVLLQKIFCRFVVEGLLT